MSLDGLAIAALKDDLTAKLVGGRIDKIHQPEPDEIILQIRQRGQNHKLLVSANPQKARIQVTSITKQNPLSPPMFCMVLRKHLEGGRILNFSQPSLERIVEIEIENYDELGQLKNKTLIGEFMGKHSNIILIDTEEKNILDGIKRYSFATSQHREILPGRPYQSPPIQNKVDPRSLTSEDDFKALLWKQELTLLIDKVLLNLLLGLSPQSCKEILVRSGLPLELTLNECGDHELVRLWQSFKEITAGLHTREWTPTVVLNPSGKAIAFAPFNLVQYDACPKEKGSMSEIVEHYFANREREDKVKQAKNNLLTVLTPNVNRLNKKLEIYHNDLTRTKTKENLKIMGELITANIYQIHKGLKEIEVVNYYDPEGSFLTIPLDPQLTPSENAQHYFKKYNKAKSTEEMVSEQKRLVEEELDYLESVLSNLDLATTTDEVADIKEELIATGYLKGEKIKQKPGKKPVKTKEKEKELTKPMLFISPDGFEIFIGKNNKQNDYLTLKLAKNEDLWFHTKDIPGSHVILKTKGQEPKEESILLAATLAAFYSKARASAQVPVDYTYKKNVRKPSGAKPGMVIYEGQKTLYVTPDESVLGRIQSESQ